jgi:hypothetical protein
MCSTLKRNDAMLLNSCRKTKSRQTLFSAFINTTILVDFAVLCGRCELNVDGRDHLNREPIVFDNSK